MTRIVFLVPSFDIGGAEHQILRTARGLDRRRFEPTVLAFTPGSGRLARELEAAGVPAVHLGVKWRSPFAAARLWWWLRTHRCDVLMSYMFHANVASRLVRRAAGVPYLVCSERMVEWEPPWRLAVNRATVRLADVVTTNSAAGVKFWAGQLRIPESSIRLIHNGLDVSVFRPRAVGTVRRPEIVIGNLARLHRKNA